MGRASAMRLARDGYAVAVNYRRDEQAAAQTVGAIESAGGSAFAVRGDLEDPAAIDALFAAVAQRFGHLDVLIANAAATSFRPLLETEDRHVERTFSISVTGFLRCVRRAVPLMAGRRAAIVAVSGFDTLRVLPGHGNLGAAKAAMETFVRYLAVELAPRRIRVNGVNPGYIETDSARLYAGPEYETRVRDEWIRATPAARLGRAEDVAGVIAFLCSEDSDFVLGQTIIVDGGRTLW